MGGGETMWTNSQIQLLALSVRLTLLWSLLGWPPGAFAVSVHLPCSNNSILVLFHRQALSLPSASY